MTDDWPVRLSGVTETVVATRGPNDLWNLAALGVHAPEGSDSTEEPSDTEPPASGPATARTWGRTRTWRNFRERGGGVIQFVTDPRTFVDAAVSIREEPEPVVDSADAWVRVEVERLADGESGGTQWVEWALQPTESAVERTGVRTTNRAYGAVIDATVAASRLDVDAYDTATLVDRLRYFERVVDRCGGSREREAFDRLTDRTDWRTYADPADESDQ